MNSNTSFVAVVLLPTVGREPIRGEVDSRTGRVEGLDFPGEPFEQPIWEIPTILRYSDPRRLCRRGDYLKRVARELARKHRRTIRSGATIRVESSV